MLHTITTPDDGLITLIKDDPVRPEIPASDRVNSNSRIYVWKQDDQPAAVVCVKFLESIPAAVDDMVDLVGSATTAVFYTIWYPVIWKFINKLIDKYFQCLLSYKNLVIIIDRPVAQEIYYMSIESMN